MLGIRKNTCQATALHHFTVIDNDNLLGHIGDHAKIMRDEQYGHAEFDL